MNLKFIIKRGEQAQVSEFQFEGNSRISNDELIGSIKGCIGNRWQIFDKRIYDYIAQKCLREMMSGKGFLKAEIKNILYQPLGSPKLVLIEIIEGTRFRFGEIEIEGLSVIPKEQFMTMLGQKSGDLPNVKGLRKFLYEDLSTVYKNKGFLLYDAYIEPDYIFPKTEGQDGTLNLKIIIDEGRQFKLSKITIVSAENAKPRLKRILGLSEGEIFNQSKFEKGIKRINDTKEFVFVDKDKDVEIRMDEENSTIQMVVKVKSKWLKKFI